MPRPNACWPSPTATPDLSPSWHPGSPGSALLADRQAQIPDLPGTATIASGETAGGPCLRVSRDRDTRRVWERRFLSCIGDPGSRPAAGCASEHLGEPAFRQRVAGLHAEPVRGHRRLIASAGPKRLIVTLSAGGDGRLPGALTRGPPRRAWRAALAPSGTLAVGGWGRDSTPRGTAGRTSAEVRCRRPAVCRPACADEPDQKFVRAHQADRRPGRDDRPGGTVGP